MAGRGPLQTAIEVAWWREHPAPATQLLQPLAWIYGLLTELRRSAYRHAWLRSQRLPLPVIVVGNLIVGGAGKTPTVMALVQALQRDGWRPGVISRGHGGSADTPCAVQARSDASQVGDEPLLIRRRTGVPVWVGRQRVAVARALMRAHPSVDLLIADDGLQHLALQRDAELIVFDARGAGNGRLLPAGPLREALPRQLGDGAFVLYNAAAPSTALPGYLAQRRLGSLQRLPDWWQGPGAPTVPLAALQNQHLLAAAGIGEPERFFSMLDAAGLNFRRLPLPDHASFDPRPWPDDGSTLIVTEKDAVKLAPDARDAGRIVVATLDFQLPGELLAALRPRLTRRRHL